MHESREDHEPQDQHKREHAAPEKAYFLVPPPECFFAHRVWCAAAEGCDGVLAIGSRRAALARGGAPVGVDTSVGLLHLPAQLDFPAPLAHEGPVDDHAHAAAHERTHTQNRVVVEARVI